MSERVLNWGPGFPAAQNFDLTTELSLGTRFTVSSDVDCLGVQFYVPEVIPTGPSPAAVSVWNILDTVTPLAVASFEWDDYSALLETAQKVYFASPLALEIGETYVAVVQTFEYWSGTTAYPFPLTTSVITAIADNGWVHVGYGYPEIENGSGYSFGVSPIIDIPTTVVSKDVGVVYNTFSSVGDNEIEVLYGVGGIVSNSFALQHDVRLRVSKSCALQHDVRKVVSPAKVFSLKYDVSKRVSKNCSVRYGVRVPIASSKSVVVQHDVRSRASNSVAVVYDTGIVGLTTVSKELEIKYHTLVTPTVDEVITVATPSGSVPPQVITTSF